MKLLSKIKAFFRFHDQEAEMEVSAAEIKQGRVFLHPVEDTEHVYCIKTEAVDIIISPHENIREEDVEILDVKKRETEKEERKKEEEEKEKEKQNHRERAAVERRKLLDLRPKMKRVSFSLYEDEYDMLMTNIRENGYRKTEFLLAWSVLLRKPAWKLHIGDIQQNMMHAVRRFGRKCSRPENRTK